MKRGRNEEERAQGMGLVSRGLGDGNRVWVQCLGGWVRGGGGGGGGGEEKDLAL